MIAGVWFHPLEDQVENGHDQAERHGTATPMMRTTIVVNYPAINLMRRLALLSRRRCVDSVARPFASAAVWLLRQLTHERLIDPAAPCEEPEEGPMK